MIAGPTAGGKTELAIACARLAESRGLVPPGGAQVVSADAFQVYRGLDIATGKPTPAERRGVAHHMLDILEPTEAFTVAQWLELATGAIAGIESLPGGGWPIVAGGTHLYIKALLDGLFEGPGADHALRARLASIPPETLRAELERVDPVAAGRIHRADLRRTIRALEVYRLTGRPISEHQRQWDAGGREADGPTSGKPPAGRLLLVTMHWGAEAINARINRRVKAMFEAGLVGETRQLIEAGRLGHNAAQALGTRQIAEAIASESQSGFSLINTMERVKIETRRLAKNQRTWLRRLATDHGQGHRHVRLEAEGKDPNDMAQIIVDQCFRTDLAPSSADPAANEPD